MPDSSEIKTRPGRDTKAQKERTRRKILDTALAEFAEQGYFQASTRDIAKRADMAAGLMYRYFRTKEELVRELIEEALSAWRREQRQCDGLQAAADLREFIVEDLLFRREFLFGEQKPMGRFLLRHFFREDLPGRERLLECALPGPELGSRITAARESGEIKPKIEADSIRLLAEMLYAKCLQSFYFPDADFPPLGADDARRRITDLAQSVLGNLLKAPSLKKAPVSPDRLQGSLF